MKRSTVVIVKESMSHILNNWRNSVMLLLRVKAPTSSRDSYAKRERVIH